MIVGSEFRLSTEINVNKSLVAVIRVFPYAPLPAVTSPQPPQVPAAIVY